MPRMGSWTILRSATCATRETRLRRMVILTRPRRLIRGYDWGHATPNPDPIPNTGCIMHTRMAKLGRMTRLPKLTRLTRLPGKTTLTRAARITRTLRLTILTRMTRLT